MGADTYDGNWEGWQRRYEERLSSVEREVTAHLAVCEERHKEVGRRFDHADAGRQAIYGEIKELRGALSLAHAQNQTAIHHVDRTGLERGLSVALAVLLAILAGALGYFFKH